jgi:broad specificity phosphatase PhoE
VAAVLLLVRHGRTGHNAGRKILGRADVPLDEVGHKQAEALGSLEVLKNAATVVSSPLRRALDTASAIGLPVEVDERWTEIDYGVHDGIPVEASRELWRRWGADPGDVPDGGESLAAMGERVRRACGELCSVAAEADVVVVTHVSPIKAAVSWALGVGDHIAWRMFVDVASLTRIAIGRDGPSLRSFNETWFRPSS